MNYMKQVANMLGVEIDEEFSINILGGRYKFGEDNFWSYSFLEGEWVPDGRNIKGLLNGNYTIIKFPKPILNEGEKKYLSGIIRPWENEVVHIRKFNSYVSGYEYLEIHVKTEIGISMTTLPYFKQGTMYKGMETNRKYSLEDLGI